MAEHRLSNSQRRFSRDGFVPLSQSRSGNDVTVDIPLNPVTSQGQTGHRGGNSNENGSPSNEGTLTDEKAGLFHRSRGRRRTQYRERAKRRGEEDEGALTTMGRVYDKILNFSIITRYFLYVLPLAVLIAVPIIVSATVNTKTTVGDVSVIRLFAWIEVVWLSLWIAKIVAKTLPSIFEFLCGIVSSGTRKYALAIKALEIPLSLAGWALVSLVTFKPITVQPAPKPKDPKQPPPDMERAWQGVMYHLLWALFIATLVVLLEKMLIQMISISYHRKQFNSKIQDSKHNVYLLSLLYDASRTLFPAYGNDFAEEDYIINDSITAGGSKSGGGARSGSVTPMRLLRDVGRVGDKLTSAFGNIAHEITGKQVFNPNSAHSVVVEALEKTRSCEALAKRIWMSFVVEGRDALYEDDIMEVLGSTRHDEALEAFAAIDRDGNGDISLDEMIMTVMDFSRERHSIATSMHDVDQAINVLDKLLCFIIFIIIIFVFVAFLNSSFTTTLATAGTALLSMSFVFAATAQEVLGSCIFLFVKHPYDVGDRVDIDGEALTVEHISLLFCVFRRVESHKMVQVPNIVLNTNWIDNVSRSKAMREEVKMYIDFGTTLEDIQGLKNEMQKFVADKENSRDFQPDVDVEILGIAEMNKLELRIEIRHKSNWSNETLRAARRSKFMCALVLALRRVPIYGPGGGDPALGDMSKPSYSVAISDAEANKNRDDFAAKKEAKRLIPTTPVSPSSPTAKGQSTANDLGRGGSKDTETRNRGKSQFSAESMVVDALNVRKPTTDAARDAWESYREDMDTSAAAEDAAARAEAARRGADVEEVRGMLRRESTRGRRKAGDGAGNSLTPASSSNTGATAGHQRTQSTTTSQMPTVTESRPGTATGSDVPVASRGAAPSYSSHPAVGAPAAAAAPGANNGYGGSVGMPREERLPAPARPSNEYARPPRPYSPTSPPSMSSHPAMRYQSPSPPPAAVGAIRPGSPAMSGGNGRPPQPGSPQRMGMGMGMGPGGPPQPGSPQRMGMGPGPQGNAFADRSQAYRPQPPPQQQPPARPPPGGPGAQWR